MKKLCTLFLAVAILACQKEKIEPEQNQPALKTVYHYSDNVIDSRACSPATNLQSFVNDGYLNFTWIVTGGAQILFTVDGLVTNTQWFAGASWTGISIPLDEVQSLCGSTGQFHITTYCDPWYIGTDSSLISKQYASGNINMVCPPVIINPVHGHGHSNGHGNGRH